MSEQEPQWPIERRTMPAHLEAEAAANPDGWVYEIDGSMVSNPAGYVPAEAILGGLAVGPDGRATGEYARNPGHGQVRDDFTRLECPDHWLGWLPDTPAVSVRGQLQAISGGPSARIGTGVGEDHRRASIPDIRRPAADRR